MHGLERACYKRPVQAENLTRIVDEVEEEIFRGHDKEVPSSEIGRLVTERLRRVDQVAYVRFASVYRQFKTLDELVAEARAVIDAQRYDVPGQGRLFIEGQARAAAAAAESGQEGEIPHEGNGGEEKGRGKRRGSGRAGTVRGASVKAAEHGEVKS